MNVHTHADARTVGVRLSYSPTEVVLEVSDDGVGLAQPEIDALIAQQWGGVGVVGMMARMEELGGRLEIRGQERGLLIRARLPLGEASLDESPLPALDGEAWEEVTEPTDG